jgi:CheY-like chemotaxis protein
VLQRSHGGLGIGLALVRGLVELHGGTVEAHSAGPGKGSEFIVRLPAAEGLGKAAAASARAGQPACRGPKGRILVVDDNRDAAESLTMILRLLGYEIQNAYDGVEAVQAAAAFHPDVVLLDIGMPKMNGYEAAQRIREQTWGQKMTLIALTGWGQEDDRKRAFEAGFDLHLTKPVDPAALETLLTSFIRTPDKAEP